MTILNNPTEYKGYRVVQDYSEIAEALKNGETVLHWEGGDSLSPLINHLEFCRIEPLQSIDDVKRGDCVFCKITDKTTQISYYMVHQVWEISNSGYDHAKWFKIGSTNSTIFGWTQEILGLAYGTDVYQDPMVYARMIEANKEEIVEE